MRLLQAAFRLLAAAVPANKGLNIAASVTGGIEMVAMAVTAAVDMQDFFLHCQHRHLCDSTTVMNISGIELDTLRYAYDWYGI